MNHQTCDVLIIGGGPAGLTAAIYLARFHLKTIVVDGGNSRAGLIPLTRNHAGFPEGISGVDLLDRMRRQAALYGASHVGDTVTALDRDDDMFLATGANHYEARAVLIATGVANHRPPMDQALHDEALRSGRLRYCPICDGFEVSDKIVGVIGTGERGMREALFLRSYTRDVTLIAPDGGHQLDDEQRQRLQTLGIIIDDGGELAFALTADGITATTAAGTRRFDSIYPALGSVIHSDLAKGLGAKAEEVGCILVDAHQRTSVPGLYAAGDVVLGLDQISHAMGEGGVAATTIRNDFADRAPLTRA